MNKFLLENRKKNKKFSCLGAMIYTKIEFVKWRGGGGSSVCASDVDRTFGNMVQ